MLKAVALVLLVLVAPAAAFAGPVSCPPGASPLLQVVESGESHGLPPSFAGRRWGIAYVICSNGKVSWMMTRVDAPIYRDNFPFVAEIRTGTGSAASFQAMVAAMAAARIGFQEDCEVSPSPPSTATGVRQLTWFGKGTRRNSFTIFSQDAAPCSFETVNMLERIGQFLSNSLTSTNADSVVIF